MNETKPKTAWIIGASSGLGASIAVRLGENGFRVAISARRKERLDELVSAHENLEAFELDVSDATATMQCANDIIEEFGAIDLFVFCAVRSVAKSGIYDGLSKGISVGLLGAAAALEPVVARMKSRQSGQIAFIGSPVGFRALPGGARDYGTVKAALQFYAEALKIELAPHNVHVQLILPGFVDTELTQQNDFPMPFLMDIDTATTRIMSGLAKPKRFRIAFPRRLIWPMHLLGLLPDSVYHWIMTKLSTSIEKPKAPSDS